MPRIAISMGDPAGIGPELAVRACALRSGLPGVEFVLYGSGDVLAEARKRYAPEAVFTLRECAPELKFSDVMIGEAAAYCGLAAYRAVEEATRDALAGRVDALVTAPMNKYSVNLAGIPFTGHTEMIAEICGTKHFAMMQSAGNLRVAFVTTHIALRDVAAHVTVERICEVAGLLEDAVRGEGVGAPKLAAAAINPHAGENGFMGGEDEAVTKPALDFLRRSGLNIEGPFPPDTLFIPRTLDRFDGILSMYHDQGHIPFKMLAFDRGVNSTLGLPIIRTSPDHGTAFDIAWSGKADPGSLLAAVDLALKRVEHRGKCK